jgi:DGQHR domain-containing protein
MTKRTEINVRVLKVTQHIGEFFVGVMTTRDLLDVSYSDLRKIEGDLDRYVGIQRKLSPNRVKEIAQFVQSIDGTFPTSVVLAVRGSNAELSADGSSLRIFESPDPETGELIPLDAVASILDGQHRIEGLRESGVVDFDVPVSIFVDADIADQAYIFATVNLAQTKVNHSLVYDLLDYSKSRSPQKSAHDIVIALDKFEKSPFFKMIKRLGTATPGRDGETLAQATVVNGILPLISKFPEQDRFDLAKHRKINRGTTNYQETPLRDLWIEERDSDIAQVLLNYFAAVRERWPLAWATREKGHILPRTNGFRAFIRLFKNVYLHERPKYIEDQFLISKDVYLRYFTRSSLKNEDFTSANFAPGTSGETSLYKQLRDEIRV